MKFKFILIHFLLDEVEIQFQNFDFFVEIIVCTLLLKKKKRTRIEGYCKWG
jgi:hypothetical protein